MPSSHLILCRPLLLLPPIPPRIRVFHNESTLRMRWPKYWSFSFSIISSKEIPGLISFRMDWLDLLAVQGTLKSLLQHHSSKASILQHSAFSTVQLSHPYVITGKPIALTGRTLVYSTVLRPWWLSSSKPFLASQDSFPQSGWVSPEYVPRRPQWKLRFLWSSFQSHTWEFLSTLLITQTPDASLWEETK